MISASNILVKYSERVLLDHINLIIGVRDKIGLVGRNGAGKSTLLKIIAGDISADEGSVSMPGEGSIGFLHQDMNLPKGKTVLAETLTAFEEAQRIEKQIELIHREMDQRTDYESAAYGKLLNDFSDLNERFLLLGGDSMEAEAGKVLKGLGFKKVDFKRLTDEFSGGWQMRIELAKILLQKPDYLLLDEPTNHLDIESIIWLESFLKDYPGAVIVISHDKTFLDNVTTRTVELELGKIFDYKAPYSKFLTLRVERKEKQQAAFVNQRKVIAQKEKTISRFMAKATKTKMAQSMQKQLDKMERIEIEQEDTSKLKIKFPPAPRSGEVVVEVHNLVKNYENLRVLNKVNFKLDRGDRMAFVGQNGQGKTTLAKIIVKELAPTEGSIMLGHNVKIGYYAQNQSDMLQDKLTLLETMEQHSPPELRTKLRGILGAFLFSGEDVDKKVTVLSGGERARLSLACLLLNPFNLLVLDEPTNHLDLPAKEVLKNALLDYDGALIVVSHDRDFLSGLTNQTLEFRDSQLHNYLGDVNFFLEKRALDSMRQVELQSGKGGGKADCQKQEISFEERKKLLRKVKNAENKIERIEEIIADIETQMAAENFYEKPDCQSVLDKYHRAKKDLERVMDDWETAHLALEEFES